MNPIIRWIKEHRIIKNKFYVLSERTVKHADDRILTLHKVRGDVSVFSLIQFLQQRWYIHRVFYNIEVVGDPESNRIDGLKKRCAFWMTLQKSHYSHTCVKSLWRSMKIKLLNCVFVTIHGTSYSSLCTSWGRKNQSRPKRRQSGGPNFR